VFLCGLCGKRVLGCDSDALWNNAPDSCVIF
jgi:hypothetical protein